MTNDQTATEMAHDHWFRHQVGLALERLASGEARLISHDEFWEDIEIFAFDLARQSPTSTQSL